MEWHGRHEFSLGAAFERTSEFQFATGEHFTIETAAGVLVRAVSFAGSPTFDQILFAGSAFLQDRWSPSSSLLL